MESRKPKGFTIYGPSINLLLMLSPEQAGKAIQAACTLFLEGTSPDVLDLPTNMAYSSISDGIREGLANYSAMCERNRKNRRPAPQAVTSRDEPSPVDDNRIEMNRIEMNREEMKDMGESPSPPKRHRFSPPTVEDVREYCSERRNGVDPQRFIDYYSANGWKVGRNKMTDWKAAVRTWERREEDKTNGNSSTGGNTPAKKWNLDGITEL